MDHKEIINLAKERLNEMPEHVFDILDIGKPQTFNFALNMSKIISKLSGFVGNLLEFEAIEFLNKDEVMNKQGEWERQDPGFPDTIFVSDIKPTPGFEMKAWLPIATEITGRFKNSQVSFLDGSTYVVLIAWLPENIIYGKPKVIDILIVTGMSVAKARDAHYHNPPGYLVREPQDTTKRTKNLQQTNTNGYIIQLDEKNEAESQKILRSAEEVVSSWGSNGKDYLTTSEYQNKLEALQSQFRYRGETNFAKIDRIEHEDIQNFKEKVYDKQFKGMKIGEWRNLLNAKRTKGNLKKLRAALKEHVGIDDLE